MLPVGVTLSNLARQVHPETAFTVLARARALKRQGKRIVELEIGDSPFPTTRAARQAGMAAIEAGETFYAPSQGLPEFCEAAAQFVREEFGIPAGPENIVVGPGAKIFETLFCETFLNPGDGVLIFSPQFPTYVPNVWRRGARVRLAPLRFEQAFRPDLEAVDRFLREDPRPKAIFLNSPHNPTGGVALKQDFQELAGLVRGKDIAIFSDEPYCHMVWSGSHYSVLAEPGMLEQGLAAYTFSKSYSMSGWRVGFCVTAAPYADVIARLINTSLSCVPPFAQRAAIAALREDKEERQRNMAAFHRKVLQLAEGLARIEGVRVLKPAGTFYVFPNVASICNRLGITSQGLADYLLEGADPHFGVACLGGECFGEAGAGFLRFSCAEPDEAIREVLDFLPEAFARRERIQEFLQAYPEYRLNHPYPELAF
jgi:aspartate aminotransferase